MAQANETKRANDQFLRIWQNALDDYRAQTSHDLTKLNSIQDANALSATILATEKQFDATRRGEPGYKKTRDVLKTCVLPLQALNSVAASALALTPFAPAATIFGAGMHLIGKLLLIIGIDACGSVSQAYDFVTELMEECRTYVERLQKYSEIETDTKFLLKLTAVLKFILEIFGQCENVMARGRARLWRDKAIFGKGKDEILQGSLERLRRYFNEEEMYTIAQVYVTGEKTASNVAKLLDFSKANRVQKTIDNLPVGTIELTAKQALDNAKSIASPPNWVDKDDVFCTWINGTDLRDRWLWGLGKVGVGKTSLVSFLAARFNTHIELSRGFKGKVQIIRSDADEENSDQSVPQDAVALFYGDYEVQGEQRPDYVFQCLIRQLLQQLQLSAIDRATVFSDQIRKLRDFTGTLHSITWTTILNDIASEFRRTYILVDALDKEESDYEALLSRLDQLRSPKVKLFVTSRDDPSMREDAAFRKAIPMIVRADTGIIEGYIRKRLLRIRANEETTEVIGASALPEFLNDEAALNKVVEIVLKNANDNFYYAEVQINSLLDEKKMENVREKLTVLTSSFKEVIRLDVERVKEQRDKHKSNVGLKALMLATFAGRSLVIEEFRYALTLLVYPATRDNHRDHPRKMSSLTMQFITECTYGLLKADSSNNIHVDEAIKTYCIDCPDYARAHYEIAEICLIFLDRMSFSLRFKSKDEYKVRKQEHPFYEYAARYWGYHVRKAGETLFLEGTLPVPLASLLKRKLFLNAVAAALHEDLKSMRMWDWAGHDTWKDCQDLAEPVLQPLHILTYLDLPRLANWWLQQHPRDVDRKSSTGTSPLYLACTLGRVRMVECLVFDFHADTALKGAQPSGYNLAAAVFAQSPEIVERLLYINAEGLLGQSNWHGRRPLAEAVTRGDMTIVRSIINGCQAAPDLVALLHAKDNDGWTALHETAAASHASAEAFKMLLEAKGGHGLLNQKTIKWKDTALHLAAKKGRHNAVVHLLESGADPTVRQSLGKTPLMLALEEPYPVTGKCTSVLFDCTKDYDLRDDEGNTIWHLAAKHGRPANLAFLIARTPKTLFAATNKNGLNPIRIAARSRKHAWRLTIELLLKECSDQLTLEDANAILDPLVQDHHEVCFRALQMLIEKMMEPWPYIPGKTTLLHKIVHHGSFEAVKMAWNLIRSEEILEYHDAAGSTPLILASIISAVDKATFLLESKANPNAQDNAGRSALHYAIKHDLADLTSSLLDHGARFDLRDQDGSTAVDLASPTSSCGQLLQVVRAKEQSRRTS